MTTWIRTDHYFRNVRNFTLTRLQTLEFRELMGVLEENNINTLALFINALLERTRPELAGATVMVCSYDVRQMKWYFSVAHSSFPQVELGGCPPEEPLVPPEEQSC
jgi:hypothetical protein